MVMSKHNNTNPNFYYDHGRNHPGEGVTYDKNKQDVKKAGRRARGKEGDRNFIPGQRPVGEKTKR